MDVRTADNIAKVIRLMLTDIVESEGIEPCSTPIVVRESNSNVLGSWAVELHACKPNGDDVRVAAYVDIGGPVWFMATYPDLHTYQGYYPPVVV